MIHINFEGSPDEKESPYCIKNENICKAWGNFISKYEGELNAKYTAWAIKAKGYLDSKKMWVINFEKAKMTNPSLLDFSLMAKPGEGYESMTIHCKDYNQSQSFNIYKKSISDTIKIALGRKLKEMKKDYILKLEKSVDGRMSKLLEILHSEPILYNLETLVYSKEKNLLEIKFDRILKDFNFLEKIMKANEN